MCRDRLAGTVCYSDVGNELSLAGFQGDVRGICEHCWDRHEHARVDHFQTKYHAWRHGWSVSGGNELYKRGERKDQREVRASTSTILFVVGCKHVGQKLTQLVGIGLSRGAVENVTHACNFSIESQRVFDRVHSLVVVDSTYDGKDSWVSIVEVDESSVSSQFVIRHDSFGPNERCGHVLLDCLMALDKVENPMVHLGQQADTRRLDSHTGYYIPKVARKTRVRQEGSGRRWDENERFHIVVRCMSRDGSIVSKTRSGIVVDLVATGTGVVMVRPLREQLPLEKRPPKHQMVEHIADMLYSHLGTGVSIVPS